MEVNLDKEDLISLLQGTSPNYSIMNTPIFKLCGEFNGSYGKWSWNSELNKCSEEQLYKMYNMCKNSWK